jgi:alpha-L-rhamnosidase
MKAPTNLTCEYHTNPLGIETPHPRFSWWLNDPTPNARQTAYQIRTDNGWDTGKIKSNQSVHVPYKGPALNSRQRVTWQVRYWNARGKPSAWSKPAWFEMGLLAKSDWQAQWIGAPWVGGPKTTSPAPFLAKSFPITKSIWSARLYVTALGLYECTLNGHRVGDAVFTPGWTDYRKRIQYQVYDVTSHLRTGRNQFDAILGDGWAVGHVAWNNRQSHADRPQLFAQLEITFTDGSQATIVTDNTWQTAQGPILEADMLMGESHDARLKPANWQPALTFDAPSAPLVAMRGPPVRRMMELQPVAPPRKAGEKWIFDLGQNMVGRVRLRIRGNRGQTVTLRFAEVLNPDGTIYTANLRAARSTDHYTLAGKGTETWEPRFTFHGFRYVEVGGLTEKPKPDMITGVVLHSDTPPTGAFSCSDKLINQLQHNIQWGQRGNFLEVPTDCPQRDERCGWTGDAQVFSRTAAFNMDVAGFFTKWQNDLADAQKPNGDFTSVAPDVVLGKCGGGPAWSDAGVICPWTMYLSYGDTRLLAEHYDSMRRFIDSLRKESKNLIRAWDGYHWQGYGDWLAQDGSGTVFGGTRKDLIGTAFFAYSTRLLSQIAQRLGRKDDAVAYGKLFERIRRAFQRHFVTPQGLVGTGTQTSYVLALHFDLLPDRLRPVALANLVRDIESRGKQSCGFVGSSYLPWVLSDNGRLDVAQRLLFQKDWPSWLYAVTQGATTIWERWDGWTKEKGFQDPSMNSFNHYAYGAVGAWLYAVVAGLQLDPEQPGYKHILIQPHPVGELTHARATLRTMYGIAESRWKISGHKFLLDITIPPNTTATVRLPGLKKTRAVGAGTHRFLIPWK